MKEGEGVPEPGVGEVEAGTQAFVLDDVDGSCKAADVGGIMDRRELDGGNSGGVINGGGESVEFAAGKCVAAAVVVGGGARSG